MQPPRLVGSLAAIALLASSIACQHATPHPVPRPSVVLAPTMSPFPSGPPPIQPQAVESRPLPRRLVVMTSDPSLQVWRSPGDTGAPAMSVPAVNPWQQPLRFPVVDRARDATGAEWVRVLLGVEPNGSTGWVPLSGLDVARSRSRIVVDLSSHRLRWFRNGRLARRFTVAVGAPSTPTTTGRFFVWASFPSEFSGAYGAYVLGLSGFSRVLTDWPGGGRMAIHGTADPSDPGHDVSHGCVRVYNPDVLKLRGVPMGTLVRIRP